MRTVQGSAATKSELKAPTPIDLSFLRPHARDDSLEFQSFIQFVSHDLQVPLRFMNGIARRLIETHGAVLPDEAVEGIAAIVSGTGEMNKLLKNLLSSSRLSNGHLDRRPINIEELSRQVFDELEAEIGDRDVAVKIDMLPSCHGDCVLLKQVLFNLLANAVKFTRTRPKAMICVGYIVDRGEVVYYVRDNGVGFESENSNALFLPFKRLESAEDFEGSGVGMALVKRIIEHHRGRVWAEGRPNQGATFYFSIGN